METVKYVRFGQAVNGSSCSEGARWEIVKEETGPAPKARGWCSRYWEKVSVGDFFLYFRADLQLLFGSAVCYSGLQSQEEGANFVGSWDHWADFVFHSETWRRGRFGAEVWYDPRQLYKVRVRDRKGATASPEVTFPTPSHFCIDLIS